MANRHGKSQFKVLKRVREKEYVISQSIHADKQHPESHNYREYRSRAAG